jgi:3-dehydroquinate dehydratase
MLYLDVAVSIPFDIMDILSLYNLDGEAVDVVEDTKEKYPAVSEAYGKLSVAIRDAALAILNVKLNELQEKRTKKKQEQEPAPV